MNGILASIIIISSTLWKKVTVLVMGDLHWQMRKKKCLRITIKTTKLTDVWLNFEQSSVISVAWKCNCFFFSFVVQMVPYRHMTHDCLKYFYFFSYRGYQLPLCTSPIWLGQYDLLQYYLHLRHHWNSCIGRPHTSYEILQGNRSIRRAAGNSIPSCEESGSWSFTEQTSLSHW